MDAITVIVAALLALGVGLAVGLQLGVQIGIGRQPQRDPDEEREAIGAVTNATHEAVTNATERAVSSATQQVVGPVKESLDRFDARLRELETSRVEWHAQLREQVESVRVTGESLRRETSSLATALRRPQVRGRWGEMHLRRAVELAGLVEHCDFSEQVTVRDGDTMFRPDLIVHLAAGREVVVDSKVPLDAFLEATSAEREEVRQAQLVRHARQLRGHIDALSAKAYWRQFDSAPEFVVLFIPGEVFLSQALETEPNLLEYAAARQVVLATPTTLIALLRTVALAWREESVAEGAREVAALGREVYERLGTLGGHVDKLGRGLSSAVDSYNSAVASLESRVFVSARKLRELDVTDKKLPAPQSVEASVRPLSAPELLDELPPPAPRRVG
ncbi:MAG TPA: DNA recombination protein RmuC [Nocardioidaceae bacterium]|jgi:DNA recombination protein RmuC|nr:DNA recombination protein RmuC [Nocardioidaceae bacterium]